MGPNIDKIKNTNWTDRVYGVDTGDSLLGMVDRSDTIVEVSSFSSDPNAMSASGRRVMDTLLNGAKKTSVVVNVTYDGSNADAVAAGRWDAVKSFFSRKDARTYRDVWPLTTQNERLKYYRTPNDNYGKSYPDRDGLMYTRWGATPVDFGDIMHVKAYYSPDAGRDAQGRKVEQAMLTTANITSNAYREQLNVFYQTTNPSLVREIKAVNDWVQGRTSMPAGLKHVLLAGPDARGNATSPRDALVKAIAGAKKEVYLASATISDPEIVKALKEARARGIKVVVGANKSDEHSSAAITDLANAGVNVKTGGKYNHANILVADDQAYFGSLRDSKNAMRGWQAEFMFKAPSWDRSFAGFLKKTIDTNFNESIRQGKTTLYGAILNDVAPVRGSTFRLVIDPSMSAKTKEQAKAMGYDLSQAPSLGVSIAASLREEAGEVYKGIPKEAFMFDRAAGLNTWGLDTESPWSLWALPFVGPQMGNRGPIDTALLRFWRDVDMTLAPPVPGEKPVTPIADTFSTTWDLTNNLVANVGGFYMITKPFLRQWAHMREWVLKGFEGMSKSSNVVVGGVGRGYLASGRSFHNFVAMVTEELMLPIASDLGLGDVVRDGINDLRSMDGRTFATKRAQLYDKADEAMQKMPGWKVLSTAGIGRVFEAYSLDFWGRQALNLGESIQGALTGRSDKFKNGFRAMGVDAEEAWAKVVGFTKSEGQFVKKYTGERITRAGMAVGIAALYANQVYGEISAAQRSDLPIQLAFESRINEMIEARGVRLPIRVFKRAGLPEWADHSPLHAIAGVGWYYAQKPAVAAINAYQTIKLRHFADENQRTLREAIAGEGIWRKAALLNSARFLSMESAQEEYQNLHGLAQKALVDDPTAAMQLVIEAELSGASPLKRATHGKQQWSIAAQFSILPMVATVTAATTRINNLQTFSFGVQGPVALSLGASLVSPIGLIYTQSKEDPTQEVAQLGYVPNTVTEAALKYALLAGAGEGVDYMLGKAGVADDNWLRVSGRAWNGLLTLPLRFSTRALAGVGTIGMRYGQQRRLINTMGTLGLGDIETFMGRSVIGTDADTLKVVNEAFIGRGGERRGRLVDDLIAKLGPDSIEGLVIDEVDQAGNPVTRAVKRWQDLGSARALRDTDAGYDAAKAKLYQSREKAAQSLHREITRQLPSFGAHEAVKHDPAKLKTYQESPNWVMRALRGGRKAGVVAATAIVGLDVALSTWGQLVSESDALKAYQGINTFLSNLPGPLGIAGKFVAQVYNVQYADHPVFKAFQDMVGREFADPAKFNQHDANLYGMVGRWTDNLKRLWAGTMGAYFSSGNKFKGTSFAGIVWDRVDDEVLAWTKSYGQPSFGGVFALSYASGLAGTDSDLDFQNRLSAAVASGVGNPLGVLSEVYNIKNKPLSIGKMFHQDSARYQMGYSGQMAMRQREMVSAWILRNNNAADVARYYYLNPHAQNRRTSAAGKALDYLDFTLGFHGANLFTKVGLWSGSMGEGRRDGARLSQLIQGAKWAGITGEAPEIDAGAIYDAPGGPFDRAQGINNLLEHNMAIYGDKAMLWTLAATTAPVLLAGAWVTKQAWNRKISPAKLFDQQRMLNVTSHGVPRMAVVGIDPLGGGAYQIADARNPIPRYQFYTVVLGEHFYTFGDQGVHITDPFQGAKPGASRFPQNINRARFQNVLRSLSNLIGSPGNQIQGTAHALDDLQKGKFVNLKAALTTVVKSSKDVQGHMQTLAREAKRAHTAHRAFFAGTGASATHADTFLDPLRQVHQGTQEMIQHLATTNASRARLETMLGELDVFTQDIEDEFAARGDTPTNAERNARIEQWLDEDMGDSTRRKVMTEALEEIHIKHVELVDGRRSLDGGLRQTLAERWGLKLQKSWNLREVAGRKVIAASGWSATRDALKKLLDPMPAMTEWRRDAAALDTAKKVSRRLMSLGAPVVGGHTNSLEEVVSHWARQSGSAAGYANWTVDDFLKHLTYHEDAGMRGWAQLAEAHRVEMEDMLERTKYLERSRALVVKGAAAYATSAVVGTAWRLVSPLFAMNQVASLLKPLQPYAALAVASDENFSDDYRRLAMETWEQEKWQQLRLGGTLTGGVIGMKMGAAYAASRTAGLGVGAALRSMPAMAWANTHAGAVAARHSVMAGLARARTVAGRAAAITAGRGVMAAAARFAPKAIAGLARLGFGVVGKVAGGVGGSLVQPGVGTIVGMIAGDWLVNTFVMPHVDRWAEAEAEKARKWDTELPTGVQATLAKFIGYGLMGLQSGLDFVLGKPAAELSRSHNPFARGFGAFLGTIHSFVSNMDPGKKSYWFYQPEAPGTSASLKNQRLRMSPLWHGNLKDAIDNQLGEQDAAMLGHHQDFLRTFFHESLFGANYNRSSIMLTPPDRPSTWNELGPTGLIFGESTSYALQARALATQPLLYSLRRRALAKNDYVLSADLDTEDSGYLMGLPAFQRGRVVNVTPYSRHSYNLSDSVTGQPPQSIENAGPVSSLFRRMGAYISSAFGNRTHPVYGVVKHHGGIDIAFRGANKQFYSPVKGKVTWVGEAAGFGSRTVVINAGGYDILLGHNAAVHIKKGDQIDYGQLLVTAGADGTATGIHVHMEVRKHEKGKTFWQQRKVDPIEYFNRAQNLSYKEMMRREAVRQGLDPRLVVSIAMTENARFNPNIQSHAGAIGLMQVMPEHFRRRGIPLSQATDPQTNIRMGVLIWKDALREAGGNVTKALQIYNAGGGKVRRVEAGLDTFKPETLKYPGRVMENFYKEGQFWGAESVPALPSASTVVETAPRPQAAKKVPTPKVKTTSAPVRHPVPTPFPIARTTPAPRPVPVRMPVTRTTPAPHATPTPFPVARVAPSPKPIPTALPSTIYVPDPAATPDVSPVEAPQWSPKPVDPRFTLGLLAAQNVPLIAAAGAALGMGMLLLRARESFNNRPQPVPAPSAAPLPVPAVRPSLAPLPDPTALPTTQPMPLRTIWPSAAPTIRPTFEPRPTPKPTAKPTPVPTPTPRPVVAPTLAPSVAPSAVPSPLLATVKTATESIAAQPKKPGFSLPWVSSLFKDVKDGAISASYKPNEIKVSMLDGWDMENRAYYDESGAALFVSGPMYAGWNKKGQGSYAAGDLYVNGKLTLSPNRAAARERAYMAFTKDGKAVFGYGEFKESHKKQYDTFIGGLHALYNDTEKAPATYKGGYHSSVKQQGSFHYSRNRVVFGLDKEGNFRVVYTKQPVWIHTLEEMARNEGLVSAYLPDHGNKSRFIVPGQIKETFAEGRVPYLLRIDLKDKKKQPMDFVRKHDLPWTAAVTLPNAPTDGVKGVLKDGLSRVSELFGRKEKTSEVKQPDLKPVFYAALYDPEFKKAVTTSTVGSILDYREDPRSGDELAQSLKEIKKQANGRPVVLSLVMHGNNSGVFIAPKQKGGVKDVFKASWLEEQLNAAGFTPEELRVVMDSCNSDSFFSGTYNDTEANKLLDKPNKKRRYLRAAKKNDKIDYQYYGRAALNYISDGVGPAALAQYIAREVVPGDDPDRSRLRRIDMLDLDKPSYNRKSYKWATTENFNKIHQAVWRERYRFENPGMSSFYDNYDRYRPVMVTGQPFQGMTLDERDRETRRRTWELIKPHIEKMVADRNKRQGGTQEYELTPLESLVTLGGRAVGMPKTTSVKAAAKQVAKQVLTYLNPLTLLGMPAFGADANFKANDPRAYNAQIYSADEFYKDGHTSLSAVTDKFYGIRSFSQMGEVLKAVKKDADGRPINLSFLFHGGVGGPHASMYLKSGVPVKPGSKDTKVMEMASAAYLHQQLKLQGFNPENVRVIMEACNAGEIYWRTKRGYKVDYSQNKKYKPYDAQVSKKAELFETWGHAATNYANMTTVQALTGMQTYTEPRVTELLRLDTLTKSPGHRKVTHEEDRRLQKVINSPVVQRPMRQYLEDRRVGRLKADRQDKWENLKFKARRVVEYLNPLTLLGMPAMGAEAKPEPKAKTTASEGALIIADAMLVALPSLHEKPAEAPEKTEKAKKAPAEKTVKKTTMVVGTQRLPEETVPTDNHKKRKPRKTDFILGFNGTKPYAQAKYPDGTEYRSMWDNNMSSSTVEEALMRR